MSEPFYCNDIFLSLNSVKTFRENSIISQNLDLEGVQVSSVRLIGSATVKVTCLGIISLFLKISQIYNNLKI